MKSLCHHHLSSIGLLVVLGLILGCTTQPTQIDLEKEVEALALLQQQEQKAHLEEQPALLVNMLHDTLTQIKNGKVSYFTKDQMKERFISYFESVEFFRWEDSSPPMFNLSDDATMANVLIQKLVIVNDVSGAVPVRDTTQFAWTELWKKKEGRWKMYQVTTTEKN